MRRTKTIRCVLLKGHVHELNVVGANFVRLKFPPGLQGRAAKAAPEKQSAGLFYNPLVSAQECRGEHSSPLHETSEKFRDVEGVVPYIDIGKI